MEVKIEQLTKDYGKHRALDSVSWNISGGMYGLLGPNGAGKTTLMRILTTLLAPTSGKVTIGEWDACKHPDQIRNVLGYLPQDFGFYKNLNAFELLDYIASLKNIPSNLRREAVETVLNEVNLEKDANRKVGGYSGGMRQRLGIAQALLGSPELMVVDEPTAGLDPEERIRFRNMLSRLSRQRTILLSTHIVADIEASCKGVAVLNHGRLVFTGTTLALSGLASGQVWLANIASSEWQEIDRRYPILSSRPEGDRIQVRLLHPQQPFRSAIAVEPTLEDGYMSLIAEVRCD